LKRILKPLGIDPQRVKLVWASAAEGVYLAKEITNFVEEIRALGPLNWPVHTHVSKVKPRQLAEVPR
jgi:coenzyme F420-reducing hydrogenase delta subunit